MTTPPTTTHPDAVAALAKYTEWANHRASLLPQSSLPFTGVEDSNAAAVGLVYEMARALDALRFPESPELFTIVFNENDVLDLADELEVDPETALDRAHSWATAIRDGMIERGNEQLASVIELDTP